MLTNRSQEKELLDLGPDYYSLQEYEHCQRMLFKINQLLGFVKNTVQILKRFSPTSALLDVGCGGGLFLLQLSKYFPAMQLKGVDISQDAIQMAQKELQKINPNGNVSFEWQQQSLQILPANSVDILLTTLVCHHLDDETLIEFLQQALRVTRNIVIINDLHRNFFAEKFYALLSPLLFRNRLITHDGLISIRRAFTRKEWHLLLQQANIENYQIKWCFPFRWSVILWKE